GRVRRAKLYYLRGRRGKSARIPERRDMRDAKARKHGFKGFTKPKGDADDLKLVTGITEDLEKKLNKLGVTKIEQIANLSDDAIAYLADKLSLGSQIEDGDWNGKAIAVMAEMTADEVPEIEDAPAADEAGEAAAETESAEKKDA
ncbi:MAG: 50S ribosomal protein L19, partial [Pseudomonadota bacterium]